MKSYRRLLFSLILSNLVLSPLQAFAASPEIFSGKWVGTGSYVLEGQMTQCSLVEFSFSATADKFTFAGGQRVCDLHSEELPAVTMDYADGVIYFAGLVVGRYTEDVLESWFQAPDPAGGMRFWRMSMRKTGTHLMYEESRTLVGEETPVISFAGILLQQ